MLSLHHRLRLARRLSDAAEGRSRKLPAFAAIAADAVSDLRAIQKLVDQHAYARARKWPLAEAHLQTCVNEQIERLGNHLLRVAAASRTQLVGMNAAGDYLGELAQLEDEFGAIEVEWRQQYLRVATEPIHLEGIDFGSFAIEFHWERLQRSTDVSCFDVVALQPNAAACNEAVTHPHVREAQLCAGDAHMPIEHALAAGRLADAFLLVKMVLTTYNRHSPFVRLEDWSGRACDDCGDLQDPEDMSYCEGCERDFCEACFSFCPTCDLCRCLSCLSRCELCQTPCCAECLVNSADCEQSCCADCLLTCTSCEQRVTPSDFDSDAGVCVECANVETEEDEAIPPTSGDSHDNVPTAAALDIAPAQTDICAISVPETAVLLSRG